MIYQEELIRLNDSDDSGQPNNKKLLVGIAAFAVMALLVAFSLNTGKPQQEVAAPSSSRYISKDLSSEVCMALGNTPKFDSGQRRAIMKDYGFDLSTIARVENCIGLLFMDWGPNHCPNILRQLTGNPDAFKESCLLSRS